MHVDEDMVGRGHGELDARRRSSLRKKRNASARSPCSLVSWVSYAASGCALMSLWNDVDVATLHAAMDEFGVDWNRISVAAFAGRRSSDAVRKQVFRGKSRRKDPSLVALCKAVNGFALRAQERTLFEHELDECKTHWMAEHIAALDRPCGGSGS